MGCCGRLRVNVYIYMSSSQLRKEQDREHSTTRQAPGSLNRSFTPGKAQTSIIMIIEAKDRSMKLRVVVERALNAMHMPKGTAVSISLLSAVDAAQACTLRSCSAEEESKLVDITG